MKRLLAAALLAASVLMAAGCTSSHPHAAGSTGTTTGSAANLSAAHLSAAAFPVTIPNTFGTTTISTAPKRVVCIGWGSQDVALALGVVPVGMSKGTFGDVDGTYPWQDDALHGAAEPTLLDDADAIPFEQVAALHPDVILAVQSGLTKSQYATLSDIAPTVAEPPTAPTRPDSSAAPVIAIANRRGKRPAVTRNFSTNFIAPSLPNCHLPHIAVE